MRWVFLILFGFVGLGFLAGAGYVGKRTHAFRAQAVQVPGVITGQLDETCSSTSNGRTRSHACYQPVVRFEHQGGSWEQPVSGERSRKSYAPGTPVRLVVDFKQTPPTVKLDGPGQWVGTLVLLLVGLLFVGGGFVGFKLWG